MNSNFGTFVVGYLESGTSIMTKFLRRRKVRVYHPICATEFKASGLRYRENIDKYTQQCRLSAIVIETCQAICLYFVSAHQIWPSHLTMIAATLIRSIPDDIAKLRIGALGETKKGKCLYIPPLFGHPSEYPQGADRSLAKILVTHMTRHRYPALILVLTRK